MIDEALGKVIGITAWTVQSAYIYILVPTSRQVYQILQDYPNLRTIIFALIILYVSLFVFGLVARWVRSVVVTGIKMLMITVVLSFLIFVWYSIFGTDEISNLIMIQPSSWRPWSGRYYYYEYVQSQGFYETIDGLKKSIASKFLV